jgi:hypothetical protein
MVCPVSGDELAYRFADPGDQPARVLRRLFLVAVVLLFVVGLRLGTGSTVFGIVLCLAAFGVELFLPRERRLAEWQALVDRRAPLAESAYGVVFQALRTREVPGEVRPQRVRYEGMVRNCLAVRRGPYRVQVSTYAFGADLVVGWTLWRRQLPAQAVLRWLTAAVAAQAPLDEPVRALADLVHAAVREGVAAAEAGREVPLAEAFGHDLPVEDGAPEPAAPPPVRPPEPRSRRRSAAAGPAAGAPGGPAGQTGLLQEQAPPRSMVPGFDDLAEERTALIGPPLQFAPFEFMVDRPVEVYTPDGAVVGRLEPGTPYWAVDEHPSGLVVQIATGAALLRDRGALHRR